MSEREMVEIFLEELLKKFDFVGSYSENAVSVRLNGRWFHVDINGNPLYKKTFDKIGPYQDGIAWVKDNNRSVQIRKDGTEVSE